MKKINKLSPLFKDERGEMMVKTIIFMLITVIIVLFSIDILNVAMKYQNVSYTSKSLAKIIECDGQVTSRIQDYLDELNTNLNMNMTYDVSDVTYINPVEQNIQFRDSFKVTVKDEAKVKILNPIFSPPIEFTLELKSDVNGISEVYWK